MRRSKIHLSVFFSLLFCSFDFLIADDKTFSYEGGVAGVSLKVTYIVSDLSADEILVQSSTLLTTPNLMKKLGLRANITQKSINGKDDFAPVVYTQCEAKKGYDKCFTQRFLGNGKYYYQRHDNINKARPGVSISKLLKGRKGIPQGKKVITVSALQQNVGFDPGKHILQDLPSAILSIRNLGISPRKRNHEMFITSGDKVRKVGLKYESTNKKGYHKVALRVLRGDRLNNLPRHVEIDPNSTVYGGTVIKNIYANVGMINYIVRLLNK